MRRLLLLILAAVIGMFTFGNTPHVLACSGGPLPWDTLLPWLIEQSDVIVVGKYAELDDVEANGIFRVQSYLYSSGPEYLTLRASDLRIIENQRNVNRFYYDCGAFGPAYLDTTTTHIYFLQAQNDGTYVIRHRLSFANQNDRITLANAPEPLETSGSQLSQQIADVAGQNPEPPNTELPYPRTTPILITTEDDQHFILPVDSTALVPVLEEELVDLRRDQYECSGPPCSVYSPNGLDKVYLRANEDDLHEIETFRPYVESNAIGQRIVFSATSETYALWHEDQIQIFVLWYPKLGYPDPYPSEYWNTNDIEMISHIAADNSIDYPVAWSPDGRTLAFSTSKGLWLWDALTADYPPQLLIPTEENVPMVRYFSPQGRYLAITDGDECYNLDLVTRRELPDGYLSANDRILLAFDTASEEPTTLEVMYLAPGIRQFEYYPEVQYRYVQWVDDAYFMAAISGFSYLEYRPEEVETSDGRTYYEAIPYLIEEPFQDVQQYHSSGLPSIGAWDVTVPYAIDEPQMANFVYKNGPGLIEISADAYHLIINRTRIALESSLPAPIKEVVWLPSAFYYIND